MTTTALKLKQAPGIGHNKPPSPFEEAGQSINDLYGEAQQWMDGEPITTKEMAAGVAKLINLIRNARKVTDAARKEEACPFDEGKAEVQARYNPLLKKADLAVDVCKKALLPYEHAQQKAQEEATAKARAEAEEKARQAREAAEAANADNLAERARADELAEEAKRAERTARSTANRRVNTKSEVGRAVGLTTRRVAKVTDYAAAAWFFWTDPVGRKAFEETVDKLARDAIAEHRTVPGVEVVEEYSVR